MNWRVLPVEGVGTLLACTGWYSGGFTLLVNEAVGLLGFHCGGRPGRLSW